jgi:hypothetical protein
MPITCTLITLLRKQYDPPKPCPGGGALRAECVNAATGERPVPGDMWYDPELRADGAKRCSPYYLANNTHRDPLTVVLPSGLHFHIDGPFWNKAGAYGPGWTVTGEAPRITMTPSINVVGNWHGYLTDGVLGVDVEGRVFP